MTRRLLGLSVLFCLWSITAQTALAGQFKHAVYVHTKARPGRVVSAQLTSSGNLDLAFTSLYDNQIIVLLGNGDGTFKAPRLFAASNPLGIAVGDFNEDGHPDLVVVELNGTGKGSVAVFLGDGNGGFGESSTYLIGEESAGVAVADFNGDGHLDLAVTDAGFEGQGADLTIFFGDGTGKFRKSQTTKSSKHPSGVATGDLNGDGRPDIVISEATDGSVGVYMNDGTGRFGKPRTYQAGNGGGEVNDVKIADLRHNGKQDLVAANASYGMVVLLNKGDGTFERERSYLFCRKSCQTADAVTVADFNLDGILDVATAAHIGDGSLYYGKGDGTFKSAVPIHNSVGNFQDSGPSIATGDFNHDGAPDLAIPIQNRGKVAIMINTQ